MPLWSSIHVLSLQAIIWGLREELRLGKRCCGTIISGLFHYQVVHSLVGVAFAFVCVSQCFLQPLKCLCLFISGIHVCLFAWLSVCE